MLRILSGSPSSLRVDQETKCRVLRRGRPQGQESALSSASRVGANKITGGWILQHILLHDSDRKLNETSCLAFIARVMALACNPSVGCSFRIKCALQGGVF